MIVALGTPERGVQWFNLDIDMGGTREGVSLPIKVDPSDPAEIAIDWDSAQQAPARGEVRSAGGRGFTPAPAPSGAATTWPSSSGSPSSATPAP